MVLAWLFRSILESITKSVLWIHAASGVWTNLHTRFAYSDVFHISDIKEDVYRFRQGTLCLRLFHSVEGVLGRIRILSIDYILFMRQSLFLRSRHFYQEAS